jgi:hypothetical protein
MELRQLSYWHRIQILWFVLQVRVRRKITNITGRYSTLRLATVAMFFVGRVAHAIEREVIAAGWSYSDALKIALYLFILAMALLNFR